METLEIEKKTKDGAKYGSFKIKVERDDFGKCVSEDSWLQGWKIKRFFRNFRVKLDNVKLKKEQ